MSGVPNSRQNGVHRALYEVPPNASSFRSQTADDDYIANKNSNDEVAISTVAVPMVTTTITTDRTSLKISTEASNKVATASRSMAKDCNENTNTKSETLGLQQRDVERKGIYEMDFDISELKDITNRILEAKYGTYYQEHVNKDLTNTSLENDVQSLEGIMPQILTEGNSQVGTEESRSQIESSCLQKTIEELIASDQQSEFQIINANITDLSQKLAQGSVMAKITLFEETRKKTVPRGNDSRRAIEEYHKKMLPPRASLRKQQVGESKNCSSSKCSQPETLKSSKPSTPPRKKGRSAGGCNSKICDAGINKKSGVTFDQSVKQLGEREKSDLQSTSKGLRKETTSSSKGSQEILRKNQQVKGQAAKPYLRKGGGSLDVKPNESSHSAIDPIPTIITPPKRSPTKQALKSGSSPTKGSKKQVEWQNYGRHSNKKLNDSHLYNNKSKKMIETESSALPVKGQKENEQSPNENYEVVGKLSPQSSQNLFIAGIKNCLQTLHSQLQKDLTEKASQSDEEHSSSEENIDTSLLFRALAQFHEGDKKSFEPSTSQGQGQIQGQGLGQPTFLKPHQSTVKANPNSIEQNIVTYSAIDHSSVAAKKIINNQIPVPSFSQQRDRFFNYGNLSSPSMEPNLLLNRIDASDTENKGVTLVDLTMSEKIDSLTYMPEKPREPVFPSASPSQSNVKDKIAAFEQLSLSGSNDKLAEKLSCHSVHSKGSYTCIPVNRILKRGSETSLVQKAIESISKSLKEHSRRDDKYFDKGIFKPIEDLRPHLNKSDSSVSSRLEVEISSKCLEKQPDRYLHKLETDQKNFSETDVGGLETVVKRPQEINTENENNCGNQNNETDSTQSSSDREYESPTAFFGYVRHPELQPYVPTQRYSLSENELSNLKYYCKDANQGDLKPLVAKKCFKRSPALETIFEKDGSDMSKEDEQQSCGGNATDLPKKQVKIVCFNNTSNESDHQVEEKYLDSKDPSFLLSNPYEALAEDDTLDSGNKLGDQSKPSLNIHLKTLGRDNDSDSSQNHNSVFSQPVNLINLLSEEEGGVHVTVHGDTVDTNSSKSVSVKTEDEFSCLKEADASEISERRSINSESEEKIRISIEVERNDDLLSLSDMDDMILVYRSAKSADENSIGSWGENRKKKHKHTVSSPNISTQFEVFKTLKFSSELCSSLERTLGEFKVLPLPDDSLSASGTVSEKPSGSSIFSNVDSSRQSSANSAESQSATEDVFKSSKKPFEEENLDIIGEAKVLLDRFRIKAKIVTKTVDNQTKEREEELTLEKVETGEEVKSTEVLKTWKDRVLNSAKEMDLKTEKVEKSDGNLEIQKELIESEPNEMLSSNLKEPPEPLESEIKVEKIIESSEIPIEVNSSNQDEKTLESNIPSAPLNEIKDDLKPNWNSSFKGADTSYLKHELQKEFVLPVAGNNNWPSFATNDAAVTTLATPTTSLSIATNFNSFEPNSFVASYAQINESYLPESQDVEPKTQDAFVLNDGVSTSPSPPHFAAANNYGTKDFYYWPQRIETKSLNCSYRTTQSHHKMSPNASVFYPSWDPIYTSAAATAPVAPVAPPVTNSINDHYHYYSSKNKPLPTSPGFQGCKIPLSQNANPPQSMPPELEARNEYFLTSIINISKKLALHFINHYAVFSDQTEFGKAIKLAINPESKCSCWRMLLATTKAKDLLAPKDPGNNLLNIKTSFEVDITRSFALSATNLRNTELKPKLRASINNLEMDLSQVLNELFGDYLEVSNLIKFHMNEVLEQIVSLDLKDFSLGFADMDAEDSFSAVGAALNGEICKPERFLLQEKLNEVIKEHIDYQLNSPKSSITNQGTELAFQANRHTLPLSDNPNFNNMFKIILAIYIKTIVLETFRNIIKKL